MNIWRVVKGLNLYQLYRLAILAVQNPILVYPTIKVTRRTMSICDDMYGEAHHKNGKANAFRHALWNMLICNAANKIHKNEQKAVL